jgi:hypothetical protein
MPAPLATVRADLRWPDKLEATLSRAYAKKPKDRYKSMAKFQTALKKVIDLPIEIEWPERWTARSKRVDADPKEGEIVPSELGAADIVTSTNPVVIPKVLEPKRALEILIRQLAAIWEQLQCAVILSIIAVLFFLVGLVASQPGSAHSPVLFYLIGLFLVGLSSNFWYVYLNSLNLRLLESVSFRKAPSFISKFEPQPVSVIAVTQIKANFYNAVIEVVGADGELVSETMVLHVVTSGHVWPEFETTGVAYPQGYLFCDDRGEPMALSILKDVAWICRDCKKN